MSQSDVSRSERVLNAIGARVGLTECGRDWLIAACDPYHDKPLQLMGYPDTNEAASVVQVVKLSQQISSNQGASALWDAHFHQFPWLGGWDANGGNPVTNVPQLVGGSDGISSFGVNPTATQSGSAWGGLSVDVVAAGANTYHYANTTISQPFSTPLLPYCTGEFRIIAMGYEIINTTSELNVQGLVTAYRYPMPDLDSAKTELVTTSPYDSAPLNIGFGYCDVLRTVAPPDSTSGAMLLEGSRQWKAKEGAYIVPTMNSSELPTGENNCALIVQLNASDNVYTSAITYPGNVTTLNIPQTSPTNVINFYSTPKTNLSKFNHSGVYFSGLSASTTLQINALYVIERFPTALDSALVVLAKPSCRRDHAALELYSEVIRQMPTGVPQRMNGLGEWFSDAVSAASDFISPVLSAIPLPGTQIAGAALRAGAAGLKGAVHGRQEVAPGKAYQPNGMSATPVTKVVIPVAKPVKKAKKQEKKKKKGK